MRILIFGINYAPELAGIAPYTTGLAEHYASHGHQVEVITGVPHYPQWRPQIANGSHNGTNPKVHRYPHYVPRRARAAGRALYEITWLASAARPLRNARADVAIGVVPSLSGGVLAWLAARRLGIPFGLIFQDTMGAAAEQSGYAGAARFAKKVQSVERLLCDRASGIAIVAEGFRAYLEGLGAQPTRIHRVRNWARWTAPKEQRSETRARLGWASDEFICLHAGNMGKKQGLDNLLSAAQTLRSESVRIVLAGGGNDRSRLSLLAKNMSLQNLSFLEVQETGSYESMLQAADVLIVNQRSSVGNMALPSKLTSYFAAGRPIVAAVSHKSETAYEVRAARAGVVVAPEAPRELATAMLHLRDSPPLARTLGQNGRLFAARHLNGESVLSQFDNFLEVVTAEANARRNVPSPAADSAPALGVK